MGDTRNYWSDCGQVFFCDGKGYGLTDTLRTICLGNEDDIKKFFDTGELNNGISSTQRQVLNKILEYRKEVSSGQSFKPVRAIRSVFARTLKRRATHTKQAAPRKRLPVRTA